MTKYSKQYKYCVRTFAAGESEPVPQDPDIAAADRLKESLETSGFFVYHGLGWDQDERSPRPLGLVLHLTECNGFLTRINAELQADYERRYWVGYQFPRQSAPTTSDIYRHPESRFADTRVEALQQSIRAGIEKADRERGQPIIPSSPEPPDWILEERRNNERRQAEELRWREYGY